MRTYVLHFLGDIERTYYTSNRTGAYVREYGSLETIPKHDRQQFEWMLENGEVVTNCGSYVYQIRHAV
jgi:hypothetical protein